MGGRETRERGPEQPAEPRESSSLTSNVDGGAQATSMLLEPDSPSMSIPERARALPTLVRSAVVGIVAIGVLIASATALRSRETLDALDASSKPRDHRSARGAAGASSASLGPSTDVLPTNTARAADAPGTSAATTATSSTPDGAPSRGEPSDATNDAASSETSRARVSELTAARAKGIPGLEALLHSYPRDPDVLKALLIAYTRQRSHAAAINMAERLLDAAPRAAEESEVQQAIVFVVNGPVDASSEALRLLATKMGSHGPDLLYEIVNAPRMGKLPKDRATTLLRDPAVRARATAELLIALDLRNTPTCSRKPLYERARENGDSRALVFLKPMTVTEGCGILRRSDCFSCLEPRKDLYDTVAAIQKRLEHGSAPN